MSIVLSYAEAEEKIQSWQADKTVQHLMAERKTNMQELSLQVGKGEGFIRQKLRRQSICLPLLYLLSVHLQANLFEPVLNLLPESVRGTRREATLQAEIDRLTTELAAMTRERDIYEKVAMGK